MSGKTHKPDVTDWAFASEGKAINRRAMFALGDFDAGIAREPVISISNVEVFRTGRFNGGQEWKVEDLQTMVNTFGQLRCPVTIDHVDEGAAYGWIKDIRTTGGSLYADFKDVPVSFAIAIHQGRYRERSIEILFRKGDEGETTPVVRAVTFLGAASPAVSLMEEIDSEALSDSIKEALEVQTFSHKSEEGDRLSVSWMKPMRFGLYPNGDPFPGTHGTVGGGRDSFTSSDVDHYHLATMDDQWDGFTSFPVLDDGYGELFARPDGHVHRVAGGIVDAAEDENYANHTHTISTFKTFNQEPNSQEETETMTPKVKEETTPVIQVFSADEREKLKNEVRAEFKANFEAQATENEQLKTMVTKMQANELATADKEQFEAIWSEALSDGHVSPGAKKAEFKTFKYLPRDEAVAEGLGEGEKTPREDYAEAIMARPKVVALGVTSKTVSPDVSYRSDEDKHNFALRDEARAILDDKYDGDTAKMSAAVRDAAKARKRATA